MATKSTLQANINAIGNGQPNTAAEARTAWNGLLDETFSAPVQEVSDGTHANTTPVAGIAYDFTFKKSGNETLIHGWIKNNNAGLINNTTLFNFSTSAYECRAYFPHTFQASNGVFITISGDEAFLNTQLGGQQTVYINTTYINND